MINRRPNIMSHGIGELILPFSKDPTRRAIVDIQPPIFGRPAVSCLILADNAGCSNFLTAGITALRINSISVHTPLDAIVCLQDVTTTTVAVFVSLQDASFDISTFFDFLKDEYPQVRRIAFAQHKSQYIGAKSVNTCQHDMVLWDPWDRGNFTEILQDILDCSISRRRSSWSDLELFESSKGTDKQAIAEIVRRYRHRIVHLVLDVTHNTTEIEDIVQEIYLNIVRSLPSFSGVCSPADWIDRISRMTIRSSFQDKLSKTSQKI